jgi:DNA-binding CsgD family transcriptional regulator
MRGHDQVSVAHELAISVSTVETHLRALRAKFGASRTRDLWPLLTDRGTTIGLAELH